MRRNLFPHFPHFSSTKKNPKPKRKSNTVIEVICSLEFSRTFLQLENKFLFPPLDVPSTRPGRWGQLLPQTAQTRSKRPNKQLRNWKFAWKEKAKAPSWIPSYISALKELSGCVACVFETFSPSATWLLLTLLQCTHALMYCRHALLFCLPKPSRFCYSKISKSFDPVILCKVTPAKSISVFHPCPSMIHPSTLLHLQAK